MIIMTAKEIINEKYEDLLEFVNRPVDTIEPGYEDACLIVTHTDLDGIGGNIISWFVQKYFSDKKDAPKWIQNFKHLVVYNAETCTVEDSISDFVDLCGMPRQIIVNDLSFLNDDDDTNKFAEYLESKTNLILFDHHPSAEWMNKYAFAHVHPTGHGSASKIFLDNVLDAIKDLDINVFDETRINSLKNYIEVVSRYDTWEWRTDPKYRFDEYENILFDLYGQDVYIVRVTDMIAAQQDVTETYTEITLIENYIDKRNKKNESVSKKLHRISFKGYTMLLSLTPIGISSFSDEIGMYVPEQFLPPDTIIAVFYADNRVLSMRSTNDSLIDLSRIAVELSENNDGGGHKKAAGCKISVEDSMELIKLYYESEALPI